MEAVATMAQFDYQSEWHCSKTEQVRALRYSRFDYQSEWHCSKTAQLAGLRDSVFDYQSEWHCSKTRNFAFRGFLTFDYQSEWHCSKTVKRLTWAVDCLITSQNGTAPKPPIGDMGW